MNISEKIKILKAFSSGEDISEVNISSNYEVQIVNKKADPDYDFNFKKYKYNIVKKPKYTPYKSVEELLEDYITKCKSYDPAYKANPMERPLIYVRGPKDENRNSSVERTISCIDSFGTASKVYIASLPTSYNGNGWIDLKDLFKSFTYLDGSPVGKLS